MSHQPTRHLVSAATARQPTNRSSNGWHRLGIRLSGKTWSADGVPGWVRDVLRHAGEGLLPFVRPLRWPLEAFVTGGGSPPRSVRGRIRSRAIQRALRSLPRRAATGSPDRRAPQAVSRRTRLASLVALERSSSHSGVDRRSPPRRMSRTPVPKDRPPFHRPRWIPSGRRSGSGQRRPRRDPTAAQASKLAGRRSSRRVRRCPSSRGKGGSPSPVAPDSSLRASTPAVAPPSPFLTTLTV
jgi:hypothetical protein